VPPAVNDSLFKLDDFQDLHFLQQSTLQFKNDNWRHKQLNWNDHVEQLLHEGSFENEYLMSLHSHGKLVRILNPILKRAKYNSRAEEPILVEHIVAVGLRVLSGGRVKDQRHIVGTSLDATYKAFDDFVDAVNSCLELDIKMPQSSEEWETINRQFRSKSTKEIIGGCVGALDGFFQRTTKPSQTEVANVLSYYSGHYESYGLNCQACVKADLQFKYFGVVSPGSTNDNISYPLAPGLKETFDSLPLGLYGVADAAYTLSEKLLIPFTGANRLDSARDAYNYYLSQLRIRVEMAFGRLVNKFRILSGKIVGSMDRASAILIACARLHNFIIQEDNPFQQCKTADEEIDSCDFAPNPLAPLGMSYLPVVPDENFEVYPGISHIRDAIVEHLREYDILRPIHNIERKRTELQDASHAFVLSPNGQEWEREFVSPL
jgi:hypothetical protein